MASAAEPRRDAANTVDEGGDVLFTPPDTKSRNEFLPGRNRDVIQHPISGIEIDFGSISIATASSCRLGVKFLGLTSGTTDDAALCGDFKFLICIQK